MSSIEPRTWRSNKGDTVTFRTPAPDDAAVLIHYAKTVLLQSQFFVLEIDEFNQTEEQERKWIEKYLKSPGSVLIAAEIAGKVIGLLNFECGIRRRLAHEGTLGISMLEQFQGHGIGNTMMQTLINWARLNSTIEKLALEVFATNTRAIAFYRRLGFVEEGRRVKSVKFGAGKYVDIIPMGYFV